jgi:hypothetical protein
MQNELVRGVDLEVFLGWRGSGNTERRTIHDDWTNMEWSLTRTRSIEERIIKRNPRRRVAIDHEVGVHVNASSVAKALPDDDLMMMEDTGGAVKTVGRMAVIGGETGSGEQPQPAISFNFPASVILSVAQ